MPFGFSSVRAKRRRVAGERSAQQHLASPMERKLEAWRMTAGGEIQLARRELACEPDEALQLHGAVAIEARQLRLLEVRDGDSHPLRPSRPVAGRTGLAERAAQRAFDEGRLIWEIAQRPREILCHPERDPRLHVQHFAVHRWPVSMPPIDP